MRAQMQDAAAAAAEEVEAAYASGRAAAAAEALPPPPPLSSPSVVGPSAAELLALEADLAAARDELAALQVRLEMGGGKIDDGTQLLPLPTDGARVPAA